MMTIKPKDITKIEIEENTAVAPKLSTDADTKPPNILATKDDNSQTPIMRDANLG